MSSIDSRIVSMKFDNATFEQNASTTLSTLDKLKNALGFPGAAKGLEDVNAAANKVNLGPLEGGVTSVSAKFMAMATIAITALTNITNKAIATGSQVVKSLTIDPIKSGFSEYELKMGSIQTIMAGSGESLKTVNKYLNELNTYSDKTIYSFADMTSNIGKFTNAGVSLKDSVSAIQGIANVAAISGANAGEASRAMYNFAQSLSQGSVKLMDWKSIELANMATKEFKQQLIDSAVAAGTLKKGTDGMYKTLKGTPVSATKGFNETLQEQWLTSDALITTLGKYSDTTTDIGKRATAAASDVKTFSQMMDTLKESAGSGWAQTSELIFGNFDEGKTLWTSLNNTIGGMLQASSDARNKILQDWKTLGGRDALISGLKNVFNGFMAVVKPIKDAFREIFPAKTGKDLYNLTMTFLEFTKKLKMGAETADNLKRTFKGVFALFSMAKQIIGFVVDVIVNFVSSLTSGTSGILGFTAGIGDFLVKADSALKKGRILTLIYNRISVALAGLREVIKNVSDYIGSIFSGTATAGAAAFQTSMNKLGGTFSGVYTLFMKLGNALKPFIDKVVSAFSGIGEALSGAINVKNFDMLLSTINTALFGGLVLMVKKFLKGGGIFGKSGAKGMFDSIAETFGALTNNLTAMQKNVKADTLMKLAIAVGILTLSIVALALIDPAKLTKSMTAIGIAFGQLLAAMAILDKIGKSGGFLKMPFITASMIMFSTAILILTAAVKNLSSLSWTELGKGLAGVAGLMIILAAAVKPLSANAGGMIRAGAGILVLSVGLKVLASVIADFSTMNWGEIGKGLAGMAGALVVIIAAMWLMPPSMIGTATSVAILAVALKGLASVVKDFASMNPGNIAKGILAMAGSLFVIAAAMWAMPKNMLLTAASLVVVAVALQGVARAVGTMGGMSWTEIGKGLTALAGSLLILALGLKAMTGSLAGSAALLVAAGALLILTPVLKTLGGMSLGNIAKGLLAIAGVFLVLGVAGALLGPLTPIIMGLSLAILALGAGLTLAGAGAFAFATALSILVGLGGAVSIVIGAMLASIISAIPKAMQAFGNGIVLFSAAIIKGAPAFVAAITVVILSLLKAIDVLAPRVVATFMRMLMLLLRALVVATPTIARAGLNMLNAILKAIGDNVYKMATLAVRIITNFINGIANNMGKIVGAGVNLITKFINAIADKVPQLADSAAKAVIKFVRGISKAIDDNAGELGRAGGELATAIVRGIASGIAGGIGTVVQAAKDLAKRALNAAKDFLGINSPSRAFMEVGKYSAEGQAKGMLMYSRVVENASESVGKNALDAMRASLAKTSNVLTGDLDMNPTISPVLDLSQVQREASKLNGIMATNPIVAGVSFDQAKAISIAREQLPETRTEEVPVAGPTFTFEQNNYSPKALSSIDIYRQTRNQLSLAREALKV